MPIREGNDRGRRRPSDDPEFVSALLEMGRKILGSHGSTVVCVWMNVGDNVVEG